MPTTPENKKPEGDKSPSPVKKAASVVTSKKNRGLVIAALVVVLGLIGVVFAVVNPDGGDETTKPTSSESPVEVEVPSKSDDPSEEATEEPAETEETPTDEGERWVETEAPENNDSGKDETEPDPADYPVGSPKDRGGIPKEFPLPDDFQLVGTETENGKTVINGTVGDSHEALMVFEMNAAKDYSIRSRNVDPNKMSGHWAIEGPGMPSGSVLVITPDETLQVRIPK